jgi:hypothetical protein
MVRPAAPASAILVLGMHRSGTSALTRVLNLLGADISTNLMSAASANETGFWESTEAYEIHEQLLRDLEHDWFDVSPLPPGWLDTPAAGRAAQKLIELLSRDFGTSQLWVMKDPRMCLLVPLWLRVLAELGIKPLPVLMARHPEEVVTSLGKAVGEHHLLSEGPACSRLLWIEYLLEAERETRDLKRSMVTYDQLMTDWRGTVTRIGHELDLSWPRAIDVAHHEISEFLTPSQRHHKVTEWVSRSSEADVEFAHELYLACAADGDPGQPWKKIGSLRKAYDEGMAIVDPGMREWASRSSGLTSLVAERSKDLYEHRQQLLQSYAELVQVQAALEEQSTLAAERSGELYEHRLQLQQRDAELGQARAALAEQSALVAERSGALYEHRLQLQQRDAELEQVRAAVAEQSVLAAGQGALAAEQSALVAERSAELYERRLQLQQRDAELEHVRAALILQANEYAQLEMSLRELQARTASKRWLLGRLLGRKRD